MPAKRYAKKRFGEVHSSLVITNASFKCRMNIDLDNNNDNEDRNDDIVIVIVTMIIQTQ